MKFYARCRRDNHNLVSLAILCLFVFLLFFIANKICNCVNREKILIAIVMRLICSPSFHIPYIKCIELLLIEMFFVLELYNIYIYIYCMLNKTGETTVYNILYIYILYIYIIIYI